MHRESERGGERDIETGRVREREKGRERGREKERGGERESEDKAKPPSPIRLCCYKMRQKYAISVQLCTSHFNFKFIVCNESKHRQDKLKKGGVEYLNWLLACVQCTNYRIVRNELTHNEGLSDRRRTARAVLSASSPPDPRPAEQLRVIEETIAV